ncbi:MAG: 16S rRNA (adenine(1518)-N(6)/adenine(1519)-N(6))-dimethyltransferase, partial [Candidatus Thiodiazotropha taylori]|nr:16S rRNA (adenine(1518)-N(6)/adenine(1519)-N(6))-dimethyltransferase [Candidatus Thiodiazotropha taylori]
MSNPTPHRARKRFGQNFLHDPGIIQRIVQTIAPQPDDNLVEIGPGQGAITTELLPLVSQMHAIELDRDLI